MRERVSMWGVRTSRKLLLRQVIWHPMYCVQSLSVLFTHAGIHSMAGSCDIHKKHLNTLSFIRTLLYQILYIYMINYCYCSFNDIKTVY